MEGVVVSEPSEKLQFPEAGSQFWAESETLLRDGYYSAQAMQKRIVIIHGNPSIDW